MAKIDWDLVYGEREKELLKMYERGELEEMTWEEFLGICDASHYMWGGYVIRENDERIRIFDFDLLDDSDLKYIDLNWYTDEEEAVIIDWGRPVVVKGNINNGKVYMVVIFKSKSKGEYREEFGEFVPLSGILHPTREEAEEELREYLEENEKEE